MYPVQRLKMGFLVKHVGSSELTYNILKRGSEQNNIDTWIFFQTINRPCISSLVSIAHLSEAYLFDGPLIATCLQTANELITIHSSNKRYFFINDLEWVHMPFQMKQFQYYEPIYRSPDLKLLCRSEEHKQFIELTWNRKVHGIVDKYNFYHESIIDEIFDKTNNIYPTSIYNTIQFKNTLLDNKVSI